MNVIATLALLLSPDAAFESGGVRVEGSLIQGPVLQVKEVGGRMMLVSGAVVEAIGGELHVTVAADRVLVLEPGIRATRRDDGILLSAHGKRSFILGDHAVAGPTLISVSAEGWTWAEISIKSNELRAALPRKGAVVQDTPEDAEEDVPQDTPEDAIKKMTESADEARKHLKLPSQSSDVTIRFRRVFTGDPSVVGKGVDSDTIRPLNQVSPIGP